MPLKALYSFSLQSYAIFSAERLFLSLDEDDALEYVKNLLSFLPSNNMDEVPYLDVKADLEISEADLLLDTIIPDSPNQPYDMHKVIETIVDDGEFLETQALFAPNIICG